MQTPYTYLDYNATTPLYPAVQARLTQAVQELGNPSSIHRAGRAARQLVEEARIAVAGLVNARPQDVIFTSSATEANNHALIHHQGPVLVSAIEHPAVQAVRSDALTLPVTPTGVVDLESLARWVTPQSLVAVMAVNNETGIIQPLEQIAKIVQQAGAKLHVDAVQAIGRMILPIQPDSLALSAHKMGGPSGIGALVLKPGYVLPNLMQGGGQESRRRPGTENMLGIIGFGAACAHVAAELERQAQYLTWRQQLWNKLAPSGAHLVEGANQAANTLCLIHPVLKNELQIMQLDLAGFAVSAGAACSSGKITPSPVLLAMGYSKEEAIRAIRISFGHASKWSELEAFATTYLTLGK